MTDAPKLTMTLHLHRNGGSRFSELHYRIHKDGKPTGVFHVRRTDGSPGYYITASELRFGEEVLDLMVPENNRNAEAWILERADLPEPPPSPEEAERLAVLKAARERARAEREADHG